MTIVVKRTIPGDEAAVVAASALFDEPPVVDQLKAYLGDPTCYLLLAFEGGKPIGFARGQVLRHISDRDSFFLYEIGVDEAHRRKGAARLLIETLKEMAQRAGCDEIFVLTNASNREAMPLYESTGGVRDNPDDVMWTYPLNS